MEIMGVTVFAITWPLIIILLLLAIFIIYYFVYKRNINNALNNENLKHVRMPDTRSTLSTLVTIALVAFIFYNYFKTNDLMEEISNMQQDLSNLRQRMSNQISDLEHELNNKLEEANSLLLSFDYSAEHLNIENGTVDYIFTAVLKESNENTEVFLTFKDETIAFENNSAGVFTGSLPVSIFDTDHYDGILTISDGNTQKTEFTDYIDTTYLWYNYLPIIYADFIDSIQYSDEKAAIKGVLDFSLLNTEEHSFTNAKVVIEVNGKPVITQNVDLSSYKEIYDTELVEKIYQIELDENIEAKKSDLVEIYVVAEDTAGFTHKCSAIAWKDDSVYLYHENQEDIYDSDGNLLTK